MIDSSGTFTSTWAALPLVGDNSWLDNVANWYEARITNAGLTGITSTTPFTFSKSTFKTGLSALTPTTDAAAGANSLALAWESAINASTMLIAPGDSLGAPSPATIWSVVSTSLIDAPSVLAGKAKIQELATAPLTGDASTSEVPIKLRDAILLLTASVTGLNSVIPTPGPLNSLLTPFV